MQLFQRAGIMGGKKANPYSRLVFRGASLDGTFSTVTDTNDTLTLTSADFGDEHPDRHVICVVGALKPGGAQWDTATVGGVSATRTVRNAVGSGGSRAFTAIFAAKVPTGESGNLVFVADNTVSSGINRIAWFTVLMKSLVAHASGSTSGTSGTSFSISDVDLPAQGFGIAAALSSDGAPSFTNAFTTEDDALNSFWVAHQETPFAGTLNGSISSSQPHSVLYASWKGDGT